jgi:ferredoxin
MSDFAKVVKKIEEIPKDLNLPNIKIATFGHMEGNLHPTFLFNENDENDVQNYNHALNFLYSMIITPIGGTITGEHGIGKIKTQYLELEHDPNVLNYMYEIKQIFDPNMILNPGQGKADGKLISKTKVIRRLKNQSDKILELNCMGCGFCIATCPSRIHYKSEAHSPRGRLSILFGLAYGDIKPNGLVNDIFHTCTLCGLCMQSCPAGVETYQIFEKAREILHCFKEVIQ